MQKTVKGSERRAVERLLIWVHVCFLLIYAGLVIISFLPGPPAIVNPAVLKPVSKEVALAHEYHGILISEDFEGEMYFYRDSKRCKLFTEGFREWARDKS